jgi:centrosomal CEP192-like protein
LKLLAKFAITSAMLSALLGAAGAQTWTPLNNQPGVTLGAMLQLRDGRILVHEEQSGDLTAWHILTPDSTGSYVNGTWSSGGHLPSGYGPNYFGSQVLLDGKTVAVEGGEYNLGHQDWTTLGAIGTISGSTLTWTSNSPPAGWTTIGDAESIVLPDGTYMQANCCTAQNDLFDGPNSWTATGSVNQSSNDESGFTLLTNDLVLTVDTKSSSCGTSQGSELYNQSTGVWSCGAILPVQLYNPADEEMGAAVLMYNNQVFQAGGNVNATAIYDVASNTWAVGPTPANGLDQADGPSALEPNGKVLAMLSPGLFQSGCQFVEYDPVANTLTNTVNPTNCPGDSSYVGHLMILPTGQIMFTDFSNLVEIYTPASGVVAGVAPTIDPLSGSVGSPSTNNTLSGTQLNGLSQNNAYGDDYQGDTDYPLVQLVPVSAPTTVYYATTHNESTHSIAPGTSNSTQFDVPAGLAAGNYNLYVVANGIQSNPVSVDVVGGFTLSANPAFVNVAPGNSATTSITVTPGSGFSGSVNLNASGLPTGVTATFSPNPTSSTSTLTFTASGTAALGTTNVTIQGVSGSLTSSTTVSLTVVQLINGADITLTPASESFGSVVVGTTSKAKAVTLTNGSTSTLEISGITTSGAFAQTNTCGSTLAAGKKCTINVTFSPTQTGAQTGTLSVYDNATNSPQTVSLSGTGEVQVTLTPATATFATTKVGSTSAAKVFTLKNNQNVILNSIAISTTGPFSVSSTTCQPKLTSNASCTIDVVFTPTAVGTETGTLQVSDNASNSPQTSSLKGTGK